MPTGGSDQLPSLRGNNARSYFWELNLSFFLPTHQLVPHSVPYFMRSSLPKQVGSCACLGRRRFRWGRLVQALPSSPPSLVLLRFRFRPFVFSSLALSGFARFGPGVLVLVFAPSLFFCVHPLMSPLNNFHFIFTFISPSFVFSSSSPSHSSGPELSHFASAGCVCVEHLNRCETSTVPFVLSVDAGGLEPICLSSPTKLWHFGG